MISRVVEISSPAFLTIKHQQLVIEKQGEVLGKVPIEDLGVLILDNHSLVYTQQIMTALIENNTAVVICDMKHMPSAMLVPFDAYSVHTKTLNQQIEMPEATKKRIWQKIIQAKIEAQSELIKHVNPRLRRLDSLSKKVKSGDPENIEGVAAKLYFDLLWGEDFKRQRFEPGINALLNYGYAVLRACVARSIVGAGLHPALGIHHSNQYNSFCLVDDFIEPLRPLVDFKVYEIWKTQGDDLELSPAVKREILTFTQEWLEYEGKRYPFMTALPFYAASARKCITRESLKLSVPKCLFEKSGENTDVGEEELYEQ